MHEIDSNLSVRRLVFVIANILVPASFVALVDVLGWDLRNLGSGFEVVQEQALGAFGGFLVLGSVVLTAILSRCHFGLVLNGAKMQCASGRSWSPSRLNWLGVTTNFVALIAWSGMFGVLLLGAQIGQLVVASLIAAAFGFCLMCMLGWNHRRANLRAVSLVDEWPSEDVSVGQREDHARRSLDATTNDISVVVTMAGALFAGAMTAAAATGPIHDLEATGWTDHVGIRRYGLTALCSFTAISLMLAGRMIIRLRIALAEHSEELARLRGERDNPWRFRVQERTFLLYLGLALMVSAIVLFGASSVFELGPSLAIVGVVLVVGVIRYPVGLVRAARRRVNARA